MENNIGKWAITYVNPPNPTAIGEIVGERDDWIRIRHPWGTIMFDKKYVKIFNTEIEAQKEYDDYRNNPLNYALEG
jgi:hypothetical protein